MAIDPVTAVANALGEIAAAIAMAFSGDNRKIMADVKRVKNLKKFKDNAQEAFKESDLCVPRENKKYWKLRDKCDKYD